MSVKSQKFLSLLSLLLLTGLAVVMLGCSSEPASTPAGFGEVITEAAPTLTATPALPPTATAAPPAPAVPPAPRPTATPELVPTATPTAEPTPVPEPTATPAPTATPQPTATPLPPTPTPLPTSWLSPAPEEFDIEGKQSFQLNTDLPDDVVVWVGANYGDYTGTVGLHGCPAEPGNGAKFSNGDTFIIKACAPGTATVHLYRFGTDELLQSYSVTVHPSDATASLSPAPEEFDIEGKQSFQLNTDLPEESSVWVGVNYGDYTGSLGLHGCPAEPRSGVRFNNGDTFIIKACAPGIATVHLYRNGTDELLESYSVTVNPSGATASLSPAPEEFDIEGKQSFQLNTDLPEPASVWVGVNYGDYTGTLGLRGCPAEPRSGVEFRDGDTFIIKACAPGMATVHLYRNGTDELLESYSVIINPSGATASLSPVPEEFDIEEKQSFQVNTDLPDNAAVWVGVNYGDYTGTLGFDSCPGEPQAGKRFQNGDSLVLKACSSGMAMVHLYRNGTDELLESYAVTVNPSGATASLSPPPQQFAIEEEQSFQVNADLPENASIRVGVNYGEDTGVLGFAGCPGEPLADIKFGNGDSFVLKACSPGTATVRLYQSGTAELLESYTVTIE